MLHHVFVYGTLKKGQCRENCWPIAPVAIRPAWTVGELFDLGPYPAMLPGSSRIAGQLWSFSAKDIATVIKALDQVEVTNQPGIPNEYDRVRVAAFTLDCLEHQAESYLFADARRLRRLAKVVAASVVFQDCHYVVWPVGTSWPVST